MEVAFFEKRVEGEARVFSEVEVGRQTCEIDGGTRRAQQILPSKIFN